jgi:protoheme IX farnesyltransferase
MMPVVKGKRRTRIEIFLYALAMFAAGLAPAAIGLGGPLYLACAALIGGIFVLAAFAVLLEGDEAKEPAARRLFFISLVYLFALFASLIVEHVLHLSPLALWT